jgi:hypothetical protein
MVVLRVPTSFFGDRREKWLACVLSELRGMNLGVFLVALCFEFYLGMAVVGQAPLLFVVRVAAAKTSTLVERAARRKRA